MNHRLAAGNLRKHLNERSLFVLGGPPAGFTPTLLTEPVCHAKILRFSLWRMSRPESPVTPFGHFSIISIVLGITPGSMRIAMIRDDEMTYMIQFDEAPVTGVTAIVARPFEATA
jgi:hypothetical protein